MDGGREREGEGEGVRAGEGGREGGGTSDRERERVSGLSGRRRISSLSSSPSLPPACVCARLFMRACVRACLCACARPLARGRARTPSCARAGVPVLERGAAVGDEGEAGVAVVVEGPQRRHLPAPPTHTHTHTHTSLVSDSTTGQYLTTGQNLKSRPLVKCSANGRGLRPPVGALTNGEGFEHPLKIRPLVK